MESKCRYSDSTVGSSQGSSGCSGNYNVMRRHIELQMKKDAEYNEVVKKLDIQYQEVEEEITKRWISGELNTKQTQKEFYDAWRNRCEMIGEAYNKILKEKEEDYLNTIIGEKFFGQDIDSSSQASSRRLESSEEPQQLGNESGKFQIETVESEKIVPTNENSVEEIKFGNIQYHKYEYIEKWLESGVFNIYDADEDLKREDEGTLETQQRDSASRTSLQDITHLSEDYWSHSESLAGLPLLETESGESQISDAKGKEIPLESASESRSHGRENRLLNRKYSIPNVKELLPSLWRLCSLARLPLDKLLPNRWLFGWKHNNQSERQTMSKEQYLMKLKELKNQKEKT
jgi:hypothetical protein